VKLALVLLGCVASVALGILVLQSQLRPVAVLQAILLLVSACVVGVFVLRRLTRHRPVVVMSPAGLRPAGRGLVPWADVEAVGIRLNVGTKEVGIRLRSQDRYLQSLTTTELVAATQTTKSIKIALAILSVLVKPFLGRGNSGGVSDPQPTTAGVAEQLEWLRERSGYHLSLSPGMFDRSAVKVAKAITAYQAEWGS
jgi:hypothetical protein